MALDPTVITDAAHRTKDVPWEVIFWCLVGAIVAVSGFLTGWVMRLQSKLSDSEAQRIEDFRSVAKERREETVQVTGGLSMCHKLADKLERDQEKLAVDVAQLQKDRLEFADERLAFADEKAAWKKPREPKL